MIPGDYSNLFFSGLRVMAHTRRRVPSIPSAPSAPSASSSIPSSPETEPASSSFRVRALKSLFQSMRRTPSKARTSAHGPGAAEPSLHEKKAARRRTLPAATAAPADVFSVWIAEKSPLAQGSTAAVLHTHMYVARAVLPTPRAPPPADRLPLLLLARKRTPGRRRAPWTRPRPLARS